MSYPCDKIPTKRWVRIDDIAVWCLAMFPFATLVALVLFYPESMINIWVTP